MNREYAVHVLKLPPTFDAMQLRTNYKRMALLLHPDRRTLDAESANQLFSILTESYKFLKENTEGRTDWQEMRATSQRHAGQEGHAGQADRTSFNIDTFNSKFADNRLGDENDRGYSSWMERLSPDAAAGLQRRRQEEERKRAMEQAQQQASSITAFEPEATMSSTSIPHSELGTGRIRDFSLPTDVTGHGRKMQYTDYKVAHMTASCLIDPDIVRTRQQFDTIEAYEKARAESSTNSITQQEVAEHARHDSKQASIEERRLGELRRRDELVSRHHAKLHTHQLA